MLNKMIVASGMFVLTGCQNLAAPASEPMQNDVVLAPSGLPYEESRYLRPTAVPDEDPNGVLIGPLSIRESPSARARAPCSVS